MTGRRGAIATLVDCFAALPGIGRKSAERLAYHVLRMPKEEALAFAEALRAVKENLRPCRICVVEQVRDLLAIEESGGYRGLYHVLQGRVAPLEGTGPESLSIDPLVARLREGGVSEVIMATTPNVEGDATALVVSKRLEGMPVEITRLARGLTVGASLEQANRDMIVDALTGRQRL